MIPKRVKIGWRVYKVEVGDLSTDDGLEHYGAFDHFNHVITINEDLSLGEQVCTLFHELIHGIAYGAGQHELYENENAIECVATGIFAALRDNPKLLDAIRRTK